MLEDGLAYPIRGDWIGRIVIGGILGLLAVFVIPAVLVVGYLVRVLEETIDGGEVPPEFTDWGGLLSTGAVGTLITLAYTVLPVVVYAVVVGVVSGTGGALGGDVGALVGVVGLLSFFQGENPAVYGGREADNSSTFHRRLQAEYPTTANLY